MKFFVFVALVVVVFMVIFVGQRFATEGSLDLGGRGSSSAAASSDVLDAQSLALCLSNRGDLLFGADWCPACRHQKGLFGEAASYLGQVDCDASPSACADAGVRGIPAWEIGGELHTGVQSLDQLADMSGCREEASAQGSGQVFPELPELQDWQVSEISYSWRDAKGGFHVTTEAPPKGALEVTVFR